MKWTGIFRFLAISLLILLFYSTLECTAQQAAVQHEADSALLFREYHHYLYSDMLRTVFDIAVSLPATYYSGDTVYPVLFSTDANRSFGIISGVVNALTFPQNFIPDLVVVGIGYPLKGLEDWAVGRHNHMTITYDSVRSEEWKGYLSQFSGREDLQVRSGQADSFLLFIEHELIPFVESEYRVSSDHRGIAGYSLGGLFSLYAMFNAHETFEYYFAGSPSLWSDNEIIFEMEEGFARNHDDLNARLYMSVGEFEGGVMVGDMKRMEDQLNSRNYPGLQLETKIFPDETHQTCYPAALTRALMYLYEQP